MVIEPTDKQLQLIEAALSGKYSMILFGGAVGGAKTAGLFLLFMIAQKVFPGIQVYFVRKDLATIERNSYATWNEITGKFGQPQSMTKDRRSETKNPRLEFKNGSKLFFFGENYDKDKELTRWSGLIPNWFFADEINELTHAAYLKMYERAGRYQIANGKTPPPLIVGTCNPSRGWVKEEIYDKWEKGTLPDHILYIPSKITDNPNLPKAYIENLKNLPKYEYLVYVDGNWNIQLKSGGEFFKNFELEKHVQPFSTDAGERIHLSVDSNVLPYIAVTCWQMEKKEGNWVVKQTHDIPVKDPDNIARKAGIKAGKWLKSIGYKQRVFLYGDPTTTARNNIDDEKRTFLDLFIEGLLKEGYESDKRFFAKAPGVASTGDFINAIYEGKIQGIEILISEYCKTSINDYIETKQDKDGGILKKRITDPKTKQSYEEHGHLSDTKRYFLCKVFENEFNQFQNRFSSHTDYKIGRAKQDY